jgi:hypothetical protein
MPLDKTPLIGSVEDFYPLTVKAVNRTELEPLWDEAIRTWHYLGFGKMIGRSVKYLVYAKGRPVSALSFNRATLHVEARDAFIGWIEEGRR